MFRSREASSTLCLLRRHSRMFKLRLARAGLAPGRVRRLEAHGGIRSVADLARLPERVDAMLVGTALMTAAEPGTVVRALATARVEVRR